MTNSIPNGGIGTIYIGTWEGSVVWSIEEGWEHVSVAPYKKRITPSWDDMCKVKDIFFEDEECVMQFHPPKSQYVNIMENCLHLWRATEEIPLPQFMK